MARCSREYAPVCGSNNRTYNNLCLLELDRCRGNEDTVAAYEGVCESTTAGDEPGYTETSTEKYYLEPLGPSKTNPPAEKCKSACPLVFSQVCGSNGKTYHNL